MFTSQELYILKLMDDSQIHGNAGEATLLAGAHYAQND